MGKTITHIGNIAQTERVPDTGSGDGGSMPPVADCHLAVAC